MSWQVGKLVSWYVGKLLTTEKSGTSLLTMARGTTYYGVWYYLLWRVVLLTKAHRMKPNFALPFSSLTARTTPRSCHGESRQGE